MNLNKLAFVDVETTGGNARTSRIIDIAVIRVENGLITQKFQSLVDPDTHVPQPIKNLTGITDKDLESAPSFYDISRDLLDILEGCVFVAHNVRFDYSFIKEEFKRLGIKFQAKQLCTVKLSRRLFPAQARHNLDAVIAAHELKCEKRHRALQDTQAIFDFFNLAKEKFGVDALSEAMGKIGRVPSLPMYLDDEHVKTLPTCCGVYIFYDENENPIYIGKSVNIRNRVRSHFSSDIRDAKEMKISQSVRSIKVFKTATELEALLLEAQKVKEFKPIYNIKLRQSREMYFLTKKINQDGYIEAALDYSKLTKPEQFPSILATFKSKTQAKSLLEKLSREYKLCKKLLNLEKSTQTCFRYQLKLCNGACARLEDHQTYNQRLEKAFDKFRISEWPFEKEQLIECGAGKKLIVNHWCVIGYILGKKRIIRKTFDFDLDNYKILRSALT